MAELPSAGVTIDDEAGAFSGGTGYVVVLGCAERNADVVPRVFSSAKALLAQHGYSQAAAYAALHLQDTKKPVIFVALPAEIPGAITDTDSDVTGSSTVGVQAGDNGVLEEVNGSVEVIVGGTIGTPGIVLELSLDGGFTKKRVRLGTADSYVIPYVGLELTFGVGGLNVGDTFSFTTSAPMWDGDGIADARTALAAQQKYARSFLVVEEVPDATLAGSVLEAVNAYASENDRFVVARVQVVDRDTDTYETLSEYVSAMDLEFAGIDDEPRIDLGIGRARRLCPITGWRFRRPAQWAVSIREYERRMDLHITTWWKALGTLSGWDLTDGQGNIVEYDERTVGGALAARFTCLRTWGNGPIGTFVAQSLTRASEGSNLSMTHNMAVANLMCTVIQAETENAVGQSLVLKDDGTGTEASLSLIEKRVNKALQIALLQNYGNGPRASKAVWAASRDDILNVPNATLNGGGDLNLNGTLVHINTRLRIQTAGS